MHPGPGTAVVDGEVVAGWVVGGGGGVVGAVVGAGALDAGEAVDGSTVVGVDVVLETGAVVFVLAG